MNNEHIHMWILLCITECTYTNEKLRALGLQVVPLFDVKVFQKKKIILTESNVILNKDDKFEKHKYSKKMRFYK